MEELSSSMNSLEETVSSEMEGGSGREEFADYDEGEAHRETFMAHDVDIAIISTIIPFRCSTCMSRIKGKVLNATSKGRYANAGRMRCKEHFRDPPIQDIDGPIAPSRILHFVASWIIEKRQQSSYKSAAFPIHGSDRTIAIKELGGSICLACAERPAGSHKCKDAAYILRVHSKHYPDLHRLITLGLEEKIVGK